MIASIRAIFSSDFFGEVALRALEANDWFTAGSIAYAVDSLGGEFLDEGKFAKFSRGQGLRSLGKQVGVLCAGNVPLVGFGDMFYGLVSGCRMVLKTSSRDPLMQAFGELESVTLCDTLEGFEGCDAILAMGSNQTCARLRELYSTTPMLLRGAMHSVGVLDGTESAAELHGLLDDIFIHSGMGCRNVGHLFVPCGYDFSALRAAVAVYFGTAQSTAQDTVQGSAQGTASCTLSQNWTDCIRHNRAMMTLRDTEFIDLDKLLLCNGTEDSHSPMGTITYSHYHTTTNQYLDPTTTQFVSQRGTFGTGQRPTLSDFPNSQNVIKFLQSL